ncbi:DUF5977 domain-containing protein [Chryseobacterium tructae]|uniref:DUF5977 domain-containing protein n=1 Tax=Chryseobacterium tructae TaxID=1037380 RepID=UPI0025B52F0C|nr:DUF5977 domain-containing protein [Chryseobacterium tructae]MDN3691173.1 DUF5977 domain-containing protein [Chryseobacterium tructae]
MDDFRKNPAFSQSLVSTSVHEPLVGLKISTTPNGMKDYYEYDGANRLKKMLDINSNIVKEHTYNYVGSTRFYNSDQEQTFTRTNCRRLENPGTYTYKVPANTYASEINVGDANQKALQEIASMGQNTTNTLGLCNPKPFDCTIQVNMSVYDNSSGFFSKIYSATGEKFRGTIAFNTGTINWSNIGTYVTVGKITGICLPKIFKSYSSGIDWSLTLQSNGDLVARWSNPFGNVTPKKLEIVNFEFTYDLD